ncbi:MAG: hypothetical protein F4145_01725 [Boseongicola sp. SB0675_bin_26]|nr:hypothetical protein [Boseongicola sp. SB0675_bin_26]
MNVARACGARVHMQGPEDAGTASGCVDLAGRCWLAARARGAAFVAGRGIEAAKAAAAEIIGIELAYVRSLASDIGEPGSI